MAEDKVLDAVRKLVNLAASPHRAEAESAAFRACQLIRKYGLEIIDPAEMDKLLQANTELQERVRLLEQTVGPVGGKTQQSNYGGFSATPPNSWYQAAYHAASSQTVPPPSAATGPSAPMTAPRFIAQSQFDGKCYFCGTPFRRGDSILWMRGVGTWCANGKDCYQQWDARQKARAAAGPHTVNFNMP